MKKRTAIQILKSLIGAGTSDEEAVQIVDEISKASGPHATELTAGQERPDLWTEGELHRTPGREVVNTGPSQASSGGGAEAMVRDYSNPAPQKGLVIEAEKLAAMLAPLTGTMKAIADGQTKQTGLLMAVLAKAADEEDEDEEESEVVEINAAKAKSKLDKARKLLAKADVEKALAEDADEVAEARVHKANARALRKTAAKLLVKASTAALIARKKGTDIRKAISQLVDGNALLKADINVVEEEEDDEEEEDEKGKARTPVTPVVVPTAKAGAKEGDKGNQADHAVEDGNQADTAKAFTPEMMKAVEQALSGQTVLAGKVNTILDMISGQSKSPQPVPTGMVDIMKADPNAMMAQISDKIEDAIDSGMLDNAAAMRARDLLSKYSAVRKSAYAEPLFRDQLAVAPQSVRDIFQIAA